MNLFRSELTALLLRKVIKKIPQPLSLLVMSSYLFVMSCQVPRYNVCLLNVIQKDLQYH